MSTGCPCKVVAPAANQARSYDHRLNYLTKDRRHLTLLHVSNCLFRVFQQVVAAGLSHCPRDRQLRVELFWLHVFKNHLGFVVLGQRVANSRNEIVDWRVDDYLRVKQHNVGRFMIDLVIDMLAVFMVVHA